MMNRMEVFGYQPDEKYQKPVAYFSMEMAIDQSLKTYSGGLGFLAGSHFKSAYELKQNIIGVTMLWKYGYYDQSRDTKGEMKPTFVEKQYSFLKDTGIEFLVSVHNAPVHVKAYLLQPETFKTAPVFLLTTDLPQNDWLAQTISHRLYDPNEATRIAQSIVLGAGGAKLLDILGLSPDVYHMNEGHAIPLCFYLYAKFKDMEQVKKRVVFTTHTPEMAGNEAHSYKFLAEMSVFQHLTEQQVKELLCLKGDSFNYTVAALKFAKKANGVSVMHAAVARKMWRNYEGICEIDAITNAQNKNYWKDIAFDKAVSGNKDAAIIVRKKELKTELFKIVADQCGKLFDENVLTLVWARRYAGYKRAGLLMNDWARFMALVSNTEYPIQIIWAGKPYPEDQWAKDEFNQIIAKTNNIPNAAVLTGYELDLSRKLKQGSDVWLNNPRMYHEASGTSGMTAMMNGSLNCSIPDGWFPEFAVDGVNSFVIAPADDSLPEQEKDRLENINLMDKLEKTILPLYYTDQPGWLAMMKKGIKTIVPKFDASRMADEYYTKMYTAEFPK